MSTVRENKKKAIRRRILEAAKERFLTDGFEETTIADIAGKANIGVGTLYNYFPSKSLLYMESYFREVGNPKDKLNEIISKYGNDPVLTIVHITEVYIKSYRTTDKTVMRELFTAFMESLNKHKDLGKAYADYKYVYIDFLAQILEAYKEKGMLVKSLNTKDSAFCVFSIITTNALFYIMDDKASYDDMIDNVLRQVKAFFQGKIKLRGGRK